MVNMLGLTKRQTTGIHVLATLLTGADFNWDNFLLKAAQLVAEENMHDEWLKCFVHYALSGWGMSAVVAAMAWERYMQWCNTPSST